MIIVVDNRDSFVWNLAEFCSMFDEVRVVKNSCTPSEIRKLNPDGIIISPGPGKPERRRDVGYSHEIILSAEVPILGVCLGHQIIAYVFGGRVERITPVHGKYSLIKHDKKGIFKEVLNPIRGGRYHSLAVTELPRGFKISAKSDDGTIMGIRSKKDPIEGVQFHPESVLTEYQKKEGLKMIKNFVEMCK